MILATSFAFFFLPFADPDQDSAERQVGEPDELSLVAGQVAAEVADLRGKVFRGEVRVEVADRELFLEYAAKRMEQLHGPERMEIDQSVARLSGMVPLDMDLEQVTLQVLEEQVGGFYEPTTDTFFVMQGTDPGLARLIMAHELAHALDDQYHDLDGTDRKLRGNSDALLAHHAVAEGSAQVVMGSWMLANRDSVDREALAELQDSFDSPALQSAPPFVWKPMMALYFQGQAFLERRASQSFTLRQANLDDLESAFTELPTSTEQILHPVKYWDPERRDDPVQVAFDPSVVPSDWTLELEDTFGEMVLALLSEPLDARKGMNSSPLSMLNLRYTNQAASGWGGDRYAYLRNDGSEFLHLCSVWDNKEEASEFEEAMRQLSSELTEANREVPDDECPTYATERVDDLRVDWSAWRGMESATGLELAKRLMLGFTPGQAAQKK